MATKLICRTMIIMTIVISFMVAAITQQQGIVEPMIVFTMLALVIILFSKEEHIKHAIIFASLVFITSSVLLLKMTVPEGINFEDAIYATIMVLSPPTNFQIVFSFEMIYLQITNVLIFMCSVFPAFYLRNN